MHQLRAEGSEFATSAARVFVFDAVVAAPRERVFDAIVAPPQTWKAWFPGITDGGYGSAGDHGVGATRVLGLAGIRVRETILVHEAPRHWTYRVDAASIPIARAIVETWHFEDLPDGTHVRWTFAIDPTLLFRLLPLPRTTIGAVWQRGMRNLGARLQRAS
jgi:polyketide cyclase/dehydrase/lipid transport protein